MRRLRRPQYTVPTMADGGLGGRQRLRDRLEYETSAAVPDVFPPHWTGPDVKGLLHAMQSSICAYCGLATNGLDVEHFRPKGGIHNAGSNEGYWWLAYDCSNYLLSCTVCNRNRKRTRFPLFPGAIRCTYEERDSLAVERRVLLDPAEDPVEDWLTIDAGDATARLIPDPRLQPDQRWRVQTAIDLFGLNLDPEVRAQRSKAYEEAARAAFEQRWSDLRQRSMRHRPHSLAARTILQRVAPERLPSAEEETRDLIDSLWRDLRTLISEPRNIRGRVRVHGPYDERQLHALGWALVVLRSTSPGMDTLTVDAHLTALLTLEEAETRAAIITLFRGL